MRYTKFDAPALLNEFSTLAERDAWSDEVSGYFDEGVAFNNGFTGVTSQFYNPVRTDTDTPFDEPVIDWPGFPKLVRSQFPGNQVGAWQAVQNAPNPRNLQDEYVEWHVIKQGGKLARVSFTCETTQYYEFLAANEPAKLLAIYKDLVDAAQRNNVALSDLIVAGNYRPRNKYNTQHGAVHLIHPANNLYAEVQIAAQACILRKRANGTPITDSNELIQCSRYGEPGRSSDPKIGAVVNAQARAGASVSLRNPVALYFTKWSTPGDWKKPDGTPVGNYWKLVRGSPAATPGGTAMGLHLVYEVPSTEGFLIGDIQVGGRKIEFAGEIAEQINVGLYALLCRDGLSSNPAFKCSDGPNLAPAIAAIGGKEKFARTAKPTEGETP